MVERPAPRSICGACGRPAWQCLCALIPDLLSATQLLILQHPSETRHALNTARLLALGLRSAELIVAEKLPENLQLRLTAADWRTELLFPGDDVPLLAAQVADVRPRRLVLLDGTWRKARKLLHLNPTLRALPRVALRPTKASRYRLRKAPQSGALATIEAAVQALEILEPDRDFSDLLRPFDALIEGQIQAMGQDCYRRNHADPTC